MSFLRVAYVNKNKPGSKKAIAAQQAADLKEFGERIMAHQRELHAKQWERMRKISILRMEFRNSPKQKNGSAEYQVKLRLVKSIDKILHFIENEKSGKFIVTWLDAKQNTIVPVGFTADLTNRITRLMHK